LLVLAVLAGTACSRSAPLVTEPATVPERTLIRAVAVFDGRGDARTTAQDVLIEGDRIARVAPTGAITPGEDTAVVEGAGLTLLPGLIDMHGHVLSNPRPVWGGGSPDGDRNLQSYLYCGVTTVFDPGSLDSDIFDRRAAVAAGDLLGPTIFTAGPIFTTPGGHPVALLRSLAPWWLRWYVVPHFTREVATEAEARTAVAELAAARPDAIKVAIDAIPLETPIIGEDVVGAIVDEARKHDLRTVAHVGTVADALEAARAGVAAWMHGVYKEPIPEEDMPAIVAAGIPYVATTVVFDGYADVFDGVRVATALERETAAADVLDSFAPVPEEYGTASLRAFVAALSKSRAARCDNVRRVHAAGVTVLAGADSQSGVFPGPGLHRELALLVQCGLTPVEALRAATADAARFITEDADPDFGIIAEGKRADLVLVAGDPTTDVAASEHIREVFRAGVRLERHPIANAS
jgi:imidazolonepropionase-like amidohydrolase